MISIGITLSDLKTHTIWNMSLMSTISIVIILYVTQLVCPDNRICFQTWTSQKIIFFLTWRNFSWSHAKDRSKKCRQALVYRSFTHFWFTSVFWRSWGQVFVLDLTTWLWHLLRFDANTLPFPSDYKFWLCSTFLPSI